MGFEGISAGKRYLGEIIAKEKAGSEAFSV